jgi:exopolyphosphatase/guanosine-5'-triphosphate,3'-diphosphate pyrophosphatase
MLGTSGTVTTIAGIHLGLRRYERAKIDGVWLDLAAALAVTDRLAGLDYDARVAEPCVGTDRADLVLSGCAIFSAIAKLWPCERLRVADRGLREGILLALMSQEQSRARNRRRRRRKRGRQAVAAS